MSCKGQRLASTQGRIEQKPDIAWSDGLCEFTIPDKFQVDHFAEEAGVSRVAEDVELDLSSTCLLNDQPSIHLVVGHIAGEDAVNGLERIRLDDRPRGVDGDIAWPVVIKCSENGAFDRLWLPLFRDLSARSDSSMERAWRRHDFALFHAFNLRIQLMFFHGKILSPSEFWIPDSLRIQSLTIQNRSKLSRANFENQPWLQTKDQAENHLRFLSEPCSFAVRLLSSRFWR